MHDPIFLLLVALASARVAVLIAHDVVLDKPREWFFLKFPPMDNPMLGYEYQKLDPSGNGYLPAGVTPRKWYMISELLTCTRCLTVWTTIPMFYMADSWGWALVATKLIAVMAVASWTAKKL